MPALTIATIVQKGEQALRNNSSSARLDAELLIQLVLKVDKAFLYTYPEWQLSQPEYQTWLALLKRRQQGEPMAYIRGKQAFWEDDFLVTSAVLIPRPETELLIETALSRLTAPASTVLDLGCGSGIIALCLKRARPQWQLVGADRSQAALAVAAANSKHLKLEVDWKRSDWFAALTQQKFDAVISNPPYLAQDDPHLQQGDLRFEPRSALVAGVTGLEALEHICEKAPRHLNPGGLLLLEHGLTQGPAVKKLLEAANFRAGTVLYDLAGHARVSYGFLYSKRLD